MSNEIKLETIFGTWIKVSDVENPDELIDPSDYYDIISSPDYINSEAEDDHDEEEQDDHDEDDDFFF